MKKNGVCRGLLAFALSATMWTISADHDHYELIRHRYQQIEPWVRIGFDEAMQTRQFVKQVLVTKRMIGLSGVQFLGLCKRLYDEQNPDAMPISPTPIIPKIIHQIWLGSPVPDAFKDYMQSWVNAHMGGEWEYRLWTDKEVEENIVLYNREYYDQAQCYAMKSDILRYEILYQMGGVYIDTDFECLQRPLDLFHHQYDFYTGLQPLDTSIVQLNNALIGSIPGHPLLKDCMERIRSNWDKKGAAPLRTGPIPLTWSFFEHAGQHGFRDIALPAFYFYPLGCREHELKKEEWIQKGAFAVHHWSKSWLPPKYRLERFKNLGNEELTVNFRA